MPDYPILVGAQGTALNLGSWLMKDPGPDWGFDALDRAVYSENVAADGGQYAFESAGVRRMSFPLLLASHSGWGGLMGLEGLLREVARPNAYLDLALEGIPTADIVRFDVLGGRWRPAYAVDHQRISRRLGTLDLDTQPYSYLPTEILLASAASVGLPGQLAIPQASILGDAPGLAHLFIAPTMATDYPAGSWAPDALFWSLGARASFTNFLAPASLVGEFQPGSLMADQFAVSSQMFVASISAAYGQGWAQTFFYEIAGALEPAYRGRHRVFAWMRLLPSQAYPWHAAADVTPDDALGALASAGPVATIVPAVASGDPGAFGAQPSPAYQLLDLGEIAIPYTASGASQFNQRIRVWTKRATAGIDSHIRCGGIALMPLDEAGFLPRGIVTPTLGQPDNQFHGVEFNAINDRVALDFSTAFPRPLSDALSHYRGVMPRVGASAVQLDILGGDRKASVAATGPLVRAGPAYAVTSVRYRPRFRFLKGF